MRVAGGTVFIGKDDYLEGSPVHIRECTVVFSDLKDVTVDSIDRAFDEQFPRGSSLTHSVIYSGKTYAEDEARKVIDRAALSAQPGAQKEQSDER